MESRAWNSWTPEGVVGDHRGVQAFGNERRDVPELDLSAAGRRGQRDGVSSQAAAEVRALKRRNAELGRTFESLTAATFFSVWVNDPRNRR
jgi:transposase